MSQLNNPDNSSKASEFRAPLPPPSALSAASLIKSIRASKFSSDSTSVNSTNGSLPSVRKSKFSDKPPVGVPPPGVIATKAPKAGAVAAAAAAAARINANLRAKGKLSDETLLKPIVNSSNTSPLALIKISETKKIFNSYVAKIDINDLPSNIRTYFTQVSTQETINKETGVAMSTKGQYLTPDEKKHLDGIEKQLHLFIQSPSKDKTDMAVAKLKEMISKQKLPTPSINSSSMSNSLTLPPVKPIPLGQPTLPTGNFVQEKVFVGMDYCVPEFDLKTKLIGVNYTNFNFVANSTGAKVILRGKGSGFIEPTSGREAFESMYVFISHPNQAGVDAAKKLVYNLISTVHSEYNNFRTKKPNTQSSTFSATAKPYSQYSPALPLSINSYGAMGMPATNPYGNNPYAAPSSQLPTNMYAASSVTNNFYPPNPPAVNPYSNTSASGYNIPLPQPTSHPTPVTSHNLTTDNSNNDNKVSSSNINESKSRKRRFQEEQPDDSNLLGYKQYSAQSEDDNKKTKKTNENLIKDYEEDETTSLPFWMSHK